MLAKRTSLFRSSGTAAARAAARASADAGDDIIDLTAGEIWSDLAPTIRDGAFEAIRKGVNRYTDTAGMMELREALAKKVSLDTGQMWNAEELITTTGAKQALFSAAMVVLNPGDEVIIPTPYWSTFPAQVLIAGGKPVFVETRSNGYVARVEDIEAAVTTRTRAIIINTPGNPTGAVYDAQTLMAMAQLAIFRDLWIIFDECYGEFVHGHHTHHAIVSVVPEVRPRTLIVNSFSKALALTGWRIGYLAGPKEIINAVKALQSHTTSNPNVIAQHAVLAHLQRGDGSYERQLRSQLTSAREIGLNVLSSLTRVPVPKAQGGFYFYLDLTNLLTREPWNVITDDADKIVHSLTKAGVATVPGTAFGDPAAIRFSYGTPPAKLEAGLSRIVEVLNAWERPRKIAEHRRGTHAAPKKAVILAAGFGSRLRPLTDLRPKPLVEVNGTPILHNALRNLEAVGVEEATIVIGYRKDAIQYACGSLFGGLKINYVESVVFDRTGSAYSLWLARDALLSGDCYLLEGDVFFEEDALRYLMMSDAANTAAVAPFDPSMEGSAAILSSDGFISEVRLKQTAASLASGGPPLFKMMNLIRFSGADLRTKIVPVLGDIIGSGATKAYTEELLGILIERNGLQLAAARCDDLRWYEIDSEEDLRAAERIFKVERSARCGSGHIAAAAGE